MNRDTDRGRGRGRDNDRGFIGMDRRFIGIRIGMGLGAREGIQAGGYG